MEAVLFFSSVWEYDCIEKLENNQWKCLWYGIAFQGINSIKALYRVIGIICMHIERCNAVIDKAYLSRYKYIHKYKVAKKNLINDHLQVIKTKNGTRKVIKYRVAL